MCFTNLTYLPTYLSTNLLNYLCEREIERRTETDKKTETEKETKRKNQTDTDAEKEGE